MPRTCSTGGNDCSACNPRESGVPGSTTTRPGPTSCVANGWAPTLNAPPSGRSASLQVREEGS
jgi:hypothetical protein